MGNTHFLLVNGSSDGFWKKKLEKALFELGSLEILSYGNQDLEKAFDPHFGMIILDATVVEDVEKIVFSLRSRHPNCRIVVITASPTWQRARQAFEAGAIDYLSKSLSLEELHKTFAQILTKPLPPWPR